MKVTRSQWLLVVTACLIVAASHGQSAADRPPGVDEDRWIPISDVAGIVVTEFSMPLRGTFRMNADGTATTVPEALRRGTGILMVKRGSAWTRIDLELPAPRVQPLL
jgi:hypothetical protein